MTEQPRLDRILLLENDPRFRRALDAVLSVNGYLVGSATEVEGALVELAEERADLLIADLDLPGISGIDLLRRIHGAFPEIPVIAVTSSVSVESAVELTRAGAADYLTKPFRTQHLLAAISRVVEQTRARREQARLRRRLGDHLRGLVGASRPMLRLFDRIGRVGPSNAPVLIHGETGCGKELVAQAVHRASGRDTFLPVNCGAIPEHLIESELFGHVKGAFTGADRDRDGLFHAADGGTLFLDELGELPLALQPRLLRVLEHGEVRRVGSAAPEFVDVRIVAATHRDLAVAVAEGGFREDLYWRLNVLSLHVPPLRERPTDIPILVEHFCAQLQERQGGPERCVSRTALAAFLEYPWPGNVRQLRSVMERALTFTDADEIDLEDLPGDIRSAAQGTARSRAAAERQLTLAELEREYIFEVLHRTGGNKSKAAEWLGVPRRTLYRRLEEYGTADS